MSFIVVQREKEWDERNHYLVRGVRSAEKDMLLADEGVNDYCVSKQYVCPRSANVALRILATPPSSSSSERNFCVLKLMLSNRTLLKDDIVDSLF